MRRLVCACVVRKPPKTGFLASRTSYGRIGGIVLTDRFKRYIVRIFFKFQALVIPIPGSVVMDTEYEGEATVSTNCLLSS